MPVRTSSLSVTKKTGKKGHKMKKEEKSVEFKKLNGENIKVLKKINH